MTSDPVTQIDIQMLCMDLAEGDYASAALDAGSFLLPYVTVPGKVAKKAIVEVSDDLIKSLKKYILDNSDDAVKGLSKIDDAAKASKFKGALDDIIKGNGKSDSIFKAIFDKVNNYKLSNDRFNNHILFMHGPNSRFGDKSHFNDSFDIRKGIDETLKSNKSIIKPNTHGRDGYIFERTFTHSIGKDSKGRTLNTLKVVIDTKGNVVTAFPKK